MKEKCWLYSGSSSAPAYPSKSSSFQINPSAVPLDRGFGGEVLYFDGVDVGLVKGTGRIGAGLSLSNGEETFFGPPGLELNSELLERKQDHKKYDAQNIALAGALNLYSNKRRGLSRFQLNLGVIGKYNKLSGDLWPGVGLSGIAGPVTFGYAVSEDQYVVDYSSLGYSDYMKFKYQVSTLSAGLFLNSLALDYSNLSIRVDNDEVLTIQLMTGSILLKRWILTFSGRREDSSRPDYDYKNKILKTEQIKHEVFGGIQYSATRTLMVGLFHNYYLLRELALGATLFF